MWKLTYRFPGVNKKVISCASRRRRDDLRDVTTYAARYDEQAWRIAVCLHAVRHGQAAGECGLAADTAVAAIAMADCFALQQLRILERGPQMVRQTLLEEVLQLLADKPQGIRPTEVYRKRIVPSSEEARPWWSASSRKAS